MFRSDSIVGGLDAYKPEYLTKTIAAWDDPVSLIRRGLDIVLRHHHHMPLMLLSTVRSRSPTLLCFFVQMFSPLIPVDVVSE